MTTNHAETFAVSTSPTSPAAAGSRVRAAATAIAASGALVWGSALAVVLSRLAFASHYLYHWDSVNLAMGMAHYDVRLGQPHVPGYILYVALAWLVNLVFHDANRTMVALSAVGSGLLVVVLWRLAERVFGSRRAGLIAGLLVAGDPLFWFYGGVALPHVPDAALYALAVLWLWRLRAGEDRLLFPAALVVALSAGFRQQNLIFLLPLCVFCLWRQNRKRLVLAALLVGAVCLAWLVPMVQLSGGLRAYLATAAAYSNAFFGETSLLHGAGLPGLERNLSRLYRYTLYATGWTLLALALAAPWWRERGRQVLGGGRGLFLLLWFAPSFLFYVIIHMGQHGLIFTFTPPLLLVAAGLFDVAAQTSGQSRARVPVGLVASGAAAFCGALTFLFAPEHPFAGSNGAGTGIKVLSAATLRNQGRDMAADFGLLRTQFPPAQTWVISPLCRQMSYYLPEYRVIWSDAWGAPADDAKTFAALPAAAVPAKSAQNGARFGTWMHGAGALAPLTQLPGLPGTPRYLVLFGSLPRVLPGGGPAGPKVAETIIGHTAGDRPVPVRRLLLPPGAALAWNAARQSLVVIAGKTGAPTKPTPATTGFRGAHRSLPSRAGGV